MTTLSPPPTAFATTTPRTLRLRLGVFDLSFQSALPDVLDDLAHLYRDRVIDDATTGRDQARPHIEVRAIRQPRKACRPTRYTLLGDGEELFTDRRPCEVLPYMEWAVNWRIIAAYHRHLQLHSSTLSHHGRGVMFIGASGSGKSTLAAALLTRGWKYFSDEFALVDPADLTLHPYPKALCIKSGSFGVIESLGLPLFQRRHYVKAFKGRVAYVSPADLGRDVVADPCPIEAIVLPTYTAAARPTLTEIPRAEAVIELSRQSFNRRHDHARAFDLITRIVRRTRCYRLESGEIRATCDAVESLFD